MCFIMFTDIFIVVFFTILISFGLIMGHRKGRNAKNELKQMIQQTPDSRVIDEIYTVLTEINNKVESIETLQMNDIKLKLHDINYMVNKDMPNDTEELQAYWSYLNDKVHSSSDTYTLAMQFYKKHKNFGIFANESFVKGYIGSGKGELSAKYANFNDDFLDNINSINQTCLDFFFRKFDRGMTGVDEKTFNVAHHFRDIFLEAYRMNVESLHDLYKVSRNVQRHTINTQMKSVRIGDKIIFSEDKNNIKQLVTNNKPTQALIAISERCNDTETQNIALTLMAQSVDMQKRKLISEIPQTEINSLNSKILELIELIF